MLVFDQLNKGERGLRALAWLGLGAFAMLLAGLAKIQVLSHRRYEQSLLTQSYKTVRVPALRGKILDRHEKVLADNSSRFRVDLYLEELSRDFTIEHRRLRTEVIRVRGGGKKTDEGIWDRFMAKLKHKKNPALITEDETEMLWRQARYNVVSNIIQQVATRVGVRFELQESALHNHWMRDRALPFSILPNLTQQQVAVLTEQIWAIRGVALERQPVRSYPYKTLASHVLGYLRRDDNVGEDEEDPYDYRMRDYSGGTGLEAAFDRDLRGTAGAKRILVNSGGYRVGESMFAEPVPGRNVVTTLDLDVQRVAEKALGSVNGDERGAIVVMDARSGDILAMASAPTYDPSEWLDPIPMEHWTNFYLNPVRKPLINRATAGAYNPGSTFKVITALAAFENGMRPEDTYTVEPNPHDPGHGGYRLGNRMIGDRAPPGTYDFRRAFIHSSNSYFIDQGLRMGFTHLLEMAHRFHLGERTRLQLSPREEGIGEVPDGADAAREGWPQGKLANFSIGQELTVTPIQMACMISAVANGGTVYWPRLVQRVKNGSDTDDSEPSDVRMAQVRTKLNIRPQFFDLVRAAMRDDVLSDEGTGKGSRVAGYQVCGKTGTAEIKGNGIKDKVTWFTSFAPYEDPRYTVIVVVESGASGGGTCAPVARQVYEFLRDRELGMKGAVTAR